MSVPSAPSPARRRPAQAAYLEAEHHFWHGEWREHVQGCTACRVGLRCRTASYLADIADDYGRRWQMAEREWR